MPSILVSLVSRSSKRSGLGILDTDTGFHYLQDDHSANYSSSMAFYRDIVTIGKQFYVVTPYSIRVFNLDRSANLPFFTSKQEIVHFDWPLATNLPTYIGLVPILHSLNRHRIFVANNSNCSIDELTLKGDFIQRHSLWEIAPDIFKQPKQFTMQFTYGQIRHLCETTDGKIYLTIANCNSSEEGKIIDFSTGEPFLGGLFNPHGGIISHELYFLQVTAEELYWKSHHNGILQAYDVKDNKSINPDGVAWQTTLQNVTEIKDGNAQQFRGMAIASDKIYCGAGFFGPPNKQKIPNRIVSFDIKTGCQLKSYDLPDLKKFRTPRVFGMALLPDDWQLPRPDKLTFFLAGKPVTPEMYRPPPSLSHPSWNNEKLEPLPVNKIEDKQTPNVFEGIESVQAPEQKKELSISIDHVSLCYRRTGNFFLAFNKKKRTSMEFWALRNASAFIYEGDTVGLIGRNGSGKSTFSMLISGALTPDRGKVTTNGKVQLLALGIGFRPQLTGRENVLISGSILGMSRKEIKLRMDEIEDFAELGDFFDEPIRTYSAGMKSRLGFAVSTAVQPDILILDEVMSTGDAAFRNKANKRIKEMRERTKTVIVVSHNPAQVKEMCSRVLWLEQGTLLMNGNTETILPIYECFCKNPDQWLTDNPESAGLLTRL